MLRVERRRGCRRSGAPHPAPKLAIVLLALVAMLAVCACHRGSGRFFEVVSFSNLSPEKLRAELEEAQGLEFDEASMVWEGTPGDSPYGGEVAVSVFDEHDDVVGPSQLVEGFELGGVLVDWRCSEFEQSDGDDIAHAVMGKCLLSDPIIDQRDDFMSWICAGKCKVSGQDAFWYVIVYTSDALEDGGAQAQVYVGVETFQAARITSYEELPTYFGLV